MRPPALPPRWPLVLLPFTLAVCTLAGWSRTTGASGELLLEPGETVVLPFEVFLTAQGYEAWVSVYFAVHAEEGDTGTADPEGLLQLVGTPDCDPPCGYRVREAELTVSPPQDTGSPPPAARMSLGFDCPEDLDPCVRTGTLALTWQGAEPVLLAWSATASANGTPSACGGEAPDEETLRAAILLTVDDPAR